MNLAVVIAIAAAALSIGVKVIGMPAQIRYNARRKSTEGLSRWFLVMTLLSYIMWVVHGFESKDMSLIVGQSLGVVATGILLWQVVIYRNEPNQEKSAKPTMLWYAAMRTWVQQSTNLRILKRGQQKSR